MLFFICQPTCRLVSKTYLIMYVIYKKPGKQCIMGICGSIWRQHKVWIAVTGQNCPRTDLPGHNHPNKVGDYVLISDDYIHPCDMFFVQLWMKWIDNLIGLWNAFTLICRPLYTHTHTHTLSLAKDVKLGKYTVPTGIRTPGRFMAVDCATAAYIYILSIFHYLGNPLG